MLPAGHTVHFDFNGTTTRTADVFGPNLGYIWHIWLSYGTATCYVGQTWPKAHELGQTQEQDVIQIS